MKFVAQKNDLIAAMKHVCRSVDRHTKAPILELARIVADGNHVLLAGANLDAQCEQIIKADVWGSGMAMINAHQLAKVLSKLPKKADEVTVTLSRENFVCPKTSLKQSNDLVTIDCGKISITLESDEYIADDLPNIRQVDGAEKLAAFAIECDRLQNMIARVSIAMSNEETRYYLNGINVELGQGQMLKFTATDGRRLVSSERQLSDAAGAEFVADESLILPRDSVKILAGMLKDAKGKGDAKFECTRQRIVVTIGSRQLVSKIVDGSFPDYRRVVPQNADERAVIDRIEASEIVARFTAIDDRKGAGSIRLQSNGCFSLSFKGDKIAGREELEKSDGVGDWEVGVNGKYLAELLAQIQSERVTVGFEEVGSPLVMRGIGEPWDITVLMPMRI